MDLTFDDLSPWLAGLAMVQFAVFFFRNGPHWSDDNPLINGMGLNNRLGSILWAHGLGFMVSAALFQWTATGGEYDTFAPLPVIAASVFWLGIDLYQFWRNHKTTA